MLKQIMTYASNFVKMIGTNIVKRGTLIFSIVLVVINLSWLILIYKAFKDSYLEYFTNLFGTTIIVWLVLISFTGFLIIFSLINIARLNNLKITWFVMTILAMGFLFLVGTTTIMELYAPLHINLVLRNSSNIPQTIGNISCKDNSGNMIIGEIAHCDVYPELHGITANVSFRSKGVWNITDNFQYLQFEIPANVDYIKFMISGTDNSNNTVNSEVSYPVKVYTLSEIKDANEKTISYILLLLGGVLFSVPAMMVNFKSLYSRNEDKIENDKHN